MSNSLGERILFMNSNIEDLIFFKADNRYGIYKEQLDLFMQENGLHDKDIVMESICSKFGIENLYIIEESNESMMEFIGAIDDILNEDINPLLVQDASKGVTNFNKFVDMAAAFITRTEFDEAKNLDKYIDKCDKVLADIKEERKRFRKGEKNGQVEFAALYIANIIKTILFDLVIPCVVGDAAISIGTDIAMKNNKIRKLVGILNKINIKGQSVITRASQVKNAVGLVSNIPTAIDIISQIKNVVIVAKDYEGVLDNYEKQISKTKRELEKKRKKLNSLKNGEKDMSIKENAYLTEYESPYNDIDIEDGEVKVNYQSYDDIVNGGIMKPTEEPQNKEVFHDDIDFEDDTIDPIQSSTPLDNINTLRSDPANVPVLNRDDNYYIGHNELKCYMDACKKANYESAIKDIIDANDNSNFTLENTSIILTKNELDSLDENTKYNIENSNVNFLVYE